MTICENKNVETKIIKIVIDAKQKEIEKLHQKLENNSDFLRKSDLEEYIFESTIADFIWECLHRKVKVNKQAFYDLEFLLRIGYRLLREIKSKLVTKTKIEFYSHETFIIALKYDFIREIFVLLYKKDEIDFILKMYEELQISH